MTLPRFGTDGWRAVIADGFTFDNVRLIAAATARWVKETHRGPATVAVGYDTRFLSREFARALAEEMARGGLDVLLSRNYCPTPALSFAVKKRQLAGGVMITASHNPAIYNGVKFKAAYGGPAMPEHTAAIEKCLRQAAAARRQSRGGGRIREADFMADYRRQLAKYADMGKVSAFRGRIVVNPMGGAGCSHVEGLLLDAGLDVVSVNSEPDPTFGGRGPEPIPQNLADQAAVIRESGAAIGLATDGDADRFGVLDGDGAFVQLHDLMPLLFRHLVDTRGWPGDVVRTTSMADTVDRLAAKMGRAVREVPVGFKNVTEQMLEADILLGGEESGGFGYKNHMPERDGLLSCLLLLEMLATRGQSMADAVRVLRRETGPFAYGRIDPHGKDLDGLRRRFAAARQSPPARLAGLRVSRASTTDGLKLHFQPGTWVLMRLSDTEPLARIYVAAEDDGTVNRLLRAGRKLLFGGNE